jgi:hypothetical protein
MMLAALLGMPLAAMAIDGPILSGVPSRTQAQTAAHSTPSSAATPASTMSTSTLKWRPRTKATPVSIQSNQAIKRTQLLDKLPDDESSDADAEPVEQLELRWKPDLRRISQPDPDATQPGNAGRQLPGPMSELDRALAPVRRPPDECPPRDDKRIYDITTDLRPDQGDLPHYCPLGDDPFVPRHWPGVTFTWKASGLCHKPLYFEEVALERYGHTWGYLQPVVSGVHFFGTLPILPYKMGVEQPWECMYALGYYEPGSCAPYMIYPVPLNLRGALLEAGAWTGGVLLIP